MFLMDAPLPDILADPLTGELSTLTSRFLAMQCSISAAGPHSTFVTQQIITTHQNNLKSSTKSVCTLIKKPHTEILTESEEHCCVDQTAYTLNLMLQQLQIFLKNNVDIEYSLLNSNYGSLAILGMTNGTSQSRQI